MLDVVDAVTMPAVSGRKHRPVTIGEKPLTCWR